MNLLTKLFFAIFLGGLVACNPTQERKNTPSENLDLSEEALTRQTTTTSTDRSPIGNLDSISDTGDIGGWSLDPDSPQSQIDIHFYINGKMIGYTKANKPRPDVNKVTGYPGDHGFNFKIPATYLNGTPYLVYAYGINIGSSAGHLVMKKEIPIKQDKSPIGNFDSLTAAGDISGWSLDPDSPQSQIDIHFYINGKMIGYTKANKPRPDVNKVTGYPGDHGFNFKIPATYLNGTPYLVYAYGINIGSSAGHFVMKKEVPTPTPKPTPTPIPKPTPTPTPKPTPPPTTTCAVTSVATLKSCMANIQKYSIIDFQNNVSCSSDSECCTGSSAFMNLNNKSNLTIKGNNKLVTRMNGQRICSILTAQNSKNIRIENLTFDENASVGACNVDNNCPKGFYFSNSQNITLYNTKLIHAKAYAIYVWAVDGFTFENSSLMYSGVLGLYVGHARHGMSKRVVIKNSYFFNNATNAIAIQGVTGSSITDNLITGNTLAGNHRWGRWPVDPKYGAGIMTGGGQLLIDMGDHITVEKNNILDGFCLNCGQSFIGGIELVMPESTDIGVRHLNISSNRIYNNDGEAIYLNQGSYLDSTTLVKNNTVYNNWASFNLRGSVQQIDNWIFPIKMINSFESSNDFPSGWGNWNACNPEANAFRWCPGAPEAHYQNCVVRMYTKNHSCSLDYAGMYTQGMRLDVGAGKHVMASLMVRNGGSKAQACIIYIQGSNQEISRTCKDVPTDKGWTYHGINIEGQTPSGTAYILTRIILLSPNASLDFDKVRVTSN